MKGKGDKVRFHCGTHGTLIYGSSGTTGRCRLVGENPRKAEAIEEEGSCRLSVTKMEAV